MAKQRLHSIAIHLIGCYSTIKIKGVVNVFVAQLFWLYIPKIKLLVDQKQCNCAVFKGVWMTLNDIKMNYSWWPSTSFNVYNWIGTFLNLFNHFKTLFGFHRLDHLNHFRLLIEYALFPIVKIKVSRQYEQCICM